MTDQTIFRVLEIEAGSVRNLRRLSCEWARAEDARREELLAAMEIEHWMIETCRVALS